MADDSHASTTTARPRPQLTLFVTFHIKPNLISEWKAAHRPVWAACAAEPKCILFDVFQLEQQQQQQPATTTQGAETRVGAEANPAAAPSPAPAPAPAPVPAPAPAPAAIFRLVEVWDDATREWFETEQLTKPYYAPLWARSRPTWMREVEIEYFERVGEGFSFKNRYLDGYY